VLEAEQMRRYSKSPENGLTRAFIDEAVAKEDCCCALFDGETLASYAWYSRRPTRLSELDENLILHFDPSFAYMYNAFTVPPYRGQRLHGTGVAAALRAHAARGVKGLVCYVEATNFGSLRASQRVGYARFGRVVVVRLPHRRLWHLTPGCRAYGFRIGTDG
jgi:hypothetical protein